MKWYNFFSTFYDKSLDKLYFDSRRRAVELLDLRQGQTVLDVACGTGANFVHLKNTGIEDLTLYGIDQSKGMLQRAKNNIRKNLFQNIFLFQTDARNLSPALFEEELGQSIAVDRVLCFLGLSVISDWETVLDNMLKILNKDGKIVVVDVYAEKRTFNTWLIEKIAKADTKRQIWQSFEKKVHDFHLEYLPVKEHKVGGKLFAAVGIPRN